MNPKNPYPCLLKIQASLSCSASRFELGKPTRRTWRDLAASDCSDRRSVLQEERLLPLNRRLLFAKKDHFGDLPRGMIGNKDGMVSRMFCIRDPCCIACDALCALKKSCSGNARDETETADLLVFRWAGEFSKFLIPTRSSASSLYPSPPAVKSKSRER